MNAWKRVFISLCKANLIKIEVVYYIIKEQNSYLCDIILSLTAKRSEPRIYQGFQTFFNS